MKEDYQFLKTAIDGHILEVTINRPEVYNALHPPSQQEFHEVWNEFADEEDLWIGIITGSGEKAFSAGNDLKFQASGGEMTAIPESGFAGLTNRFNLNKPIIAAVNGVAMGGGMEIALACDLIIASDNARFALPEPKVGLLPCGGGTHQLPRLIGEGWAKKMILGGEQVDAKKAFTIGLVEEVVETGISLNRALELADQANKQSPISVTACKKLIHEARTSKESYGYEKEPFVDLFDSKDQAEGVAAFLEKRPPEWKNA